MHERKKGRDTTFIGDGGEADLEALQAAKGKGDDDKACSGLSSILLLWVVL